MNLLRLRLAMLAARYGWSPAPALVLALFAAWLHFAATPALEERAVAGRAGLAARLAQAKAAAAGEQDKPLIEKRYAAFRDHLAAREDLPDMIRTLFAAARDAGLVLRRMDYQLEQEADGGYVVYHVKLPVEGTYPAIHRFAESVLLKTSAAALEDISFKRDSAASANIRASLHFALFLKAED